MKSLIKLIVILFLTNTFSYSATFTTFNTGLAKNYISYYKERLPAVIKAISNDNSDVICLQEVWFKEDRDKFVEELSSRFPYIHYEEAEPKYTSRTPSCNISDLRSMYSCKSEYCREFKDNAESVSCFFNKCMSVINKIMPKSPNCIKALFSGIALPIPLNLIRVVVPGIRKNLFAYEGSDGLMLLSKYPLNSISKIDLGSLSTLTRRNAIVATVNISDKDYNVVCTHLTPNHLIIPYIGDNFKSWEEENYAQVKWLIDNINDNVRHKILMGDFNCSLSNKDHDVSSIMADSCNYILNSGYFDEYFNKVGRCTYCANNPINNDSTINSVRDHIYTKGVSVVNYKRTFDNSVVNISSESKKFPLSDHYGVSITVK